MDREGVQTTEETWIQAISEAQDEWTPAEARQILRAVLMALRTCMTDEAAQRFARGLSAPMRRWFIQREAAAEMPYSRDRFLRHVRRELHAAPDVDAVAAVCVVLKVARYQVAPAHAVRMRNELPRDLQGLWPGVVEG